MKKVKLRVDQRRRAEGPPGGRERRRTEIPTYFLEGGERLPDGAVIFIPEDEDSDTLASAQRKVANWYTTATVVNVAGVFVGLLGITFAHRWGPAATEVLLGVMTGSILIYAGLRIWVGVWENKEIKLRHGRAGED